MEKVSAELDKYLRLVGQYDNEFAKWQARTKKLIKRYRDDTRGQSGNETAKFNILWSNVQTLIPAVFARLPKAAVARRYADNDPVGRVAANIIERALDFEVEHYPDFRSTMRYCVEDRFLGGRGVAWVRYEPHVAPQGIEDDGVQITEDIEQGEGAPPNLEQIDYECTPVDYVHWKDFGHSQARTWEEVTCVWRCVYMTREALAERFGDEMARKIPLDQGPDQLNAYRDSKRQQNLAKIFELWDKETLKVYWFAKGMPGMIDVRDDPLNLEGFFPCPRPLYATTTSDSLVPVPDFVLYQDQAMELDILSDRIDGLVKALRVRGVYDASQPALQRLMTEGDNNSLIPVDKWQAFSEKGGLKGSIDLLPLDTIAAALLQCYQARADIKAQIYEITGIADIIRGQSTASETATAQQIKGQYAGLRLRSMQEDVALFATDVLRLKAQVMCQKYQPKTLLEYAAASQMTEVDQQLIPQAIELMQDKPLRNFRISIAADSLVQIDEQQLKSERMEFLQAFGDFLEQALPVGQASPQMVPVMMELLKFGVQAFKAADSIEGQIDQAAEQIKQLAAQPQGNPEAEAAQAAAQVEQQKAQVQMQMEQAKIQAEQQAEAARFQLEQAKAAAEQQLEQARLQLEQAKIAADQQRQQFKAQMAAQQQEQQAAFDRWKAELDAATKIMVAHIAASSSSESEAESSAALQTVGTDVRAAVENMANVHGQTMEQLTQVMSTLRAPKRIVRGPDGRAVGVESIS